MTANKPSLETLLSWTELILYSRGRRTSMRPRKRRKRGITPNAPVFRQNSIEQVGTFLCAFRIVFYKPLYFQNHSLKIHQSLCKDNTHFTSILHYTLITWISKVSSIMVTTIFLDSCSAKWIIYLRLYVDPPYVNSFSTLIQSTFRMKNITATKSWMFFVQ